MDVPLSLYLLVICKHGGLEQYQHRASVALQPWHLRFSTK
jgi:hypothetical protein